MQGNQLIALAGVLQGPLIGGLDPNPWILAVEAAGPPLGLCIHGDRVIAINPFDLQLRKA